MADLERICGQLACIVAALCVAACGDDDETTPYYLADGGTGGTGGSGGSGGAGGTGGSGGAGGVSGGSGGGTGGGSTGGSGAIGGSGGAPVTCTDNCSFVRDGANGDGSDWDQAYPELPPTLERGRTYFVADGDYGSYTFDDGESGTEATEIRKATADDHGTDVGWQADYGDGVATFGPLEFSTGYYVFDGQAGRGFRVLGGFEGDVVDIGGDHVALRFTDIDGNFQISGGNQTDGACTGLGIGGDNVTVYGCEIHNIADDGVSMGGVRNVSFVGNTVHTLHGCGTDGGCGPCYNGHSDGIEMYNVKDSELVGNFVHHVSSTAPLFFGNWADSLGGGPSEYCENILLANNILYSPDTGFVAYIQDVAGIQVFHNVFWGIRQGRYGGLSIGNNVTDLDMFNNIILSLNNEHVGGSYDPANHRSDYNLIGSSLGQIPEGANDIVNGDPGFVNIPDMNGAEVSNPSPADFALGAGSPCIDAGDATLTAPATDFMGQPRDGAPDIGAIEH